MDPVKQEIKLANLRVNYSNMSEEKKKRKIKKKLKKRKR
jgi:hypothetical protein